MAEPALNDPSREKRRIGIPEGKQGSVQCHHTGKWANHVSLVVKAFSLEVPGPIAVCLSRKKASQSPAGNR
jgi:hypothetical protein